MKNNPKTEKNRITVNSTLTRRLDGIIPLECVMFAMILLCLAVSFVGCGSVSDKNVTSKNTTAAVTTEFLQGDEVAVGINGKQIYARKSSFENPIELICGQNVLHIINYESESAEIGILLSDAVNLQPNENIQTAYGGRKILISLDSLEEITVDFESDGGCVSAMVYSIDGASASFVCDLFGLSTALSDSSFGDTVLLCRSVESDGDISVLRPCTLALAECTLSVNGDFNVDFDEEGAFAVNLLNSDIYADRFYADAPECDLILPDTVANLALPYEYCLRVKSINGEIVDCQIKEISADSDLERLVDKEKLPNLYEGDTLVFTENCVIENEYKIEIPVNFEFRDGADLKSSIAVVSDKECGISVVTPDGFDDISVIFQTPEAKLQWENCKYNIAELCDIWKFASINGRPYSDGVLGGQSDAELSSVEMKKKENLVSDNIKWTVDDSNKYLFYASINCVADSDSLGNAVLSTVCDGGSVTLAGSVDLLDPLGVSVIVTDTDGKISKYLIVTDYTPTKLPVIVINTSVKSSEIPRDSYVEGNIKINCEYAAEFEDTDSIDTKSISIRGRGNSTWKWDKKPYKIKFNNKTSVLGLSEAKKWVLLANYSDKSLIRNTIALSTVKILTNMKYAPTQYPVDLFLNGEYIGVYSIGEQIEAKEGRVELTDNGTELDTGYLFEIGGTVSGDVWGVNCFRTELVKYAKIKFPEEDTLTTEQVAYITDYVTKADNAVKEKNGYDEYIDVDSLIDWFIIHELSYNLDSSFRRSCYITKDAGGKLTMGPMWDFDLAFGNFNRDKLDGSGWACLYDKDDYIWTNWMTYLLSDENFMKRLSARWDEVGNSLVEYLFSEIDRLYELVSPSAKCNFERWDVLNIKIGYQPRVLTKYNSYELQIQYLKEYITKRAAWMSENVSVVVPLK